VAFEQATPADYDRMIALLDKADKTPFERYLTATDERPADWESTEDHFTGNELSREKLLDYKAMWFLREDRLDEAAAAYRQIPDEFWNNYEYSYLHQRRPLRGEHRGPAQLQQQRQPDATHAHHRGTHDRVEEGG
jgi:hypothetical protein